MREWLTGENWNTTTTEGKEGWATVGTLAEVSNDEGAVGGKHL